MDAVGAFGKDPGVTTPLEPTPMPKIRPTYANVMSTVAVFIALGGSSYAAVTLAANSVGNAELKADAVTTDKVKNGTLLSGDFKAGQIPAGPKGATGATGPRGYTGATGATGSAGTSTAYGADAPQVLIYANPSELTAISKYVPAGTYAINAKLWMNNNTGFAYGYCVLRQSGQVMDITRFNFDDANESISLQGILANYGGGSLTVGCQEQGPSNNSYMNDVKLTAIKVTNNG